MPEPVPDSMPDSSTIPRQMNISEARKLFPGVEDQVYLNVSLNGLMPATSRDAVLAHLDLRVMGRAVKEELHAQAERVRSQVAKLIGADGEEVAITKNVSEGLNIFAAGLDWKSSCVR